MQGMYLTIALIAFPGISFAQETVTYTYDALGRLKATSVSGGPNHAASTALSYDNAGNRVSYVTTTPSSPGGIQAVADNVTSTSYQECMSQTAIYPLDNDHGPNGPIEIIAFSSNDGLVLIGNAVSLIIPGTNSFYVGTYTAEYTIRNSNNETSSSTITFTIAGPHYTCD